MISSTSSPAAICPISADGCRIYVESDILGNKNVYVATRPSQ